MKRIMLLSLIGLNIIWANFNFGECSGSGTFEQKIVHYNNNYESTTTVGVIPLGIKGLRIDLISDKDVDIRLYGANEDKIVHWPYGMLSKSYAEDTIYHDINVSYSGYNGVDGEKGHEYIEVHETTPTIMTMKAFGYQSGYATVNYSWTGREGCEQEISGDADFVQNIEKNATVSVGTIPPNVKNLKINLISENDLDIQLYGADGTAIVSWKPEGLLSKDGMQSIIYHDMNITWSGYLGVDGHNGNEYIKVTPQTTELLSMKVFGYKSGIAQVSYSWGNSIPEDTIAPVITLIGEHNISLALNSTYIEQGFNVSDNSDGEIIKEIQGTVDTTKVGIYTLKYIATDASHNKAEMIRVVKVFSNEENIIKSWELDFKDNPEESGWKLRDDSSFNSEELKNGVWKASTAWKVLDTISDYDFNHNTSVFLRMKNTEVGNLGAVFWVNVDYTSEGSASIYTAVTLQEDGTQSVTLHTQDSNKQDVVLAEVTGLGSGFVDLFLYIDVEADTIDFWINGENRGTYTYQRTDKLGDKFATILPWGTESWFEYLKIESGDNISKHPSIQECKDNEHPEDATCVPNPTDVTPPIITMLGKAELTIYQGDTYKDAGATAEDDRDGDITERIEVVNHVGTKVGTYIITYKVTDKAGNSATVVSRTVNVIEKIVKPDMEELIKNGGNSEGPVAITDVWKSFGETWGELTREYNSQTFIYSTNKGANSGMYQEFDTEIGREYHVKAILIGADVNEEKEWKAASYISISDVLPSVGASHVIKESIKVTGGVEQEVSFNFVAQSEKSYLAIRSSEEWTYANARAISVKATNSDPVVDETPPELVLNGSATMLIKLGTEYHELGAKATDFMDGDLTNDINISGMVDTSTEGLYEITYSVSDKAGNIASLTRVVRVSEIKEVSEKDSVIILTDAEMDDKDSLRRLMFFSNEMDIKGIIYSKSQYHWKNHYWSGAENNNEIGTEADELSNIIKEWGEKYEKNLKQYDANYPSYTDLLNIVKMGDIDPKDNNPTVGIREDISEGSKLITNIICDEGEKLPLYIQGWGGISTLARALIDAEKECKDTLEDKLNNDKITLYAIANQDYQSSGTDDYKWNEGAIGWVAENFPSLRIILNNGSYGYVAYKSEWRCVPESFYNENSETGFYSKTWMDEYVNGILGYTNVAYDQIIKGEFSSEGDSPSFFNNINIGLRNNNNPNWGGLGGRFYKISNNVWTDISDTITDEEYSSLRCGKISTAKIQKPGFRWYPTLANDWRARLDWARKGMGNRAPIVTIEGSLNRIVNTGKTVSLSAEGSYDPNNDSITYKWWVYSDVSDISPIHINNNTQKDVNITIPVEVQGKKVHVILEVSDNGTPSLTRYKRIILDVVDTANTDDVTPPIITMLGKAELTIYQGDTYKDAGATAEDDRDGDLTNNITIDGSVDTSTEGVYEIVYTVADAAKNSTSVKRVVKVKEIKETFKPWEHGNLIATADGRMLQHEDGTGFFWMGDTIWSMPKLDIDDIKFYLDKRKEQDFTVIQFCLTWGHGGSSSSKKAFYNDDYNSPNEDFWKDIDAIVAEAEERGLYLAILPMWHNIIHKDSDPVTEERKAQEREEARVYGEFLAERYTDRPNIIWVNGADVGNYRFGLTEHIWTSIGNSLHNNDDNHLIAFHSNMNAMASEKFEDSGWLDINMDETGHQFTKLDKVLRNYIRTANPEKRLPSLDGESSYKDIITWIDGKGWDHGGERVKDDMIRKSAYMQLFYGAFGHTYGHHAIWQTYDGGKYAIEEPTKTWKNALNDSSINQGIVPVINLMRSRPLLNRVPKSDLVESKILDDDAATLGDGFAFVFVPKETNTVTIRMNNLPYNSVKAWWYNTITGEATAIGQFSNEENRQFTTPAAGQCWVLVLDNTLLEYPAPGKGKSDNKDIAPQYKDDPVSLPGTVEAEFYDNGGEGVAYHDSDSVNTGGTEGRTTIRTNEGVDIESSENASNGYNLGWVAAGEYVTYSVDVQKDGYYDIVTRVASESNGKLKVTLSKSKASRILDVAPTGGWQVWTDIRAEGIYLEKGEQILRVDIVEGVFNLDKLQFSEGEEVADTTPPIIILKGSTIVNITVGTSYMDAGATATDDVDGDITSRITNENLVNTNEEGTYTVTYSVIDDAGNEATQIRTVKVQAESSNEIHISNSNTVYSNLQEAINSASDGATVILENGVYSAGVVVNTNNLTIKNAEGSDNVVLTGEKAITGWNYDSGRDLYYAPSPCADVRMLFKNGEEIKASRYPNSGNLFVDNNESSTRFTVKDFDKNNNFIKGAIAHIRLSQWRASSRRVASFDGSINLLSDVGGDTNTIAPNFKVAFTQVLGAIDANNEWAWNDNKIYMKSSGTPENITAACSEYGIYLDANAKHTEIYGLNITKIKGHGITKKDETRRESSDNLFIENNEISYVSGMGISIMDHYNETARLPAATRIENNEIHHAYAGGIWARTDNIVVRGNYIHDIGGSKRGDDVLANGAQNMLAGIHLTNSSGARVSYNRLDKIGYNGISIDNGWAQAMAGEDRIIEHNYITNVVLTLADGAGIYTHTSKTASGNPSALTRDIIRNNIVENCLGSHGISNAAGEAEGIYLDDKSSHIDVYKNTIINASEGLYYHNVNDVNAYNNAFLLSFHTSIQVKQNDWIDGLAPHDRHNVLLSNNKMLAGDAYAYQLVMDQKPYEYLTSSDLNTIRINNGTNVKIKKQYSIEVGFDDWKNLGYDNSSNIIKDSTQPVILINPSAVQKTFNNLGGCRKFDNSSLNSSSETVEPYGSLVLFGCDYYAPSTYNESN